MSQFTTRVELHDADSSDYEELHEEMEKRGFTRTVTSSDGITYQLPTAEYNYEGSAERSDVLRKAKAAAGAVKESYEVVVTESNGRKWFGLPQVKKAAA
jgi:hypothetical protein